MASSARSTWLSVAWNAGDEASDVGIRTPDLLDDRLDRLGVGGQPLEFLAGGGLGSVAARFGRIGREDDEFAVLLRDRDKEEGAGEALVDPLRRAPG